MPDIALDDGPLRAARHFRLILEAMARPGRIVDLDAALAQPPLGAAAVSVACCLIDTDAPAWLAPQWRSDTLVSFLRFETGAAPVDDPSACAFAFGEWDALGGVGFPLGTPEYPERSTTLVIEVPKLEAGTGVTLTGPGIETRHRLDAGLPREFWAARAANHAQFPLGWDAILTCGTRLAALPRTTRAEG
jgi:alpha-D-ribose 1-methylphosphonate 5-triphosphate synthase subunit PhnH